MRGTAAALKISTSLVETGLARSLDLLRQNLTSEGVLASAPSEDADRRNYTSIFGRDAAICALGMAISGEWDLMEGARAGLRTLGRHQAQNGQIPKFVRPQSSEVDFWYTGCIDATLWWLIALHYLDRWDPSARLGEELRGQAERSLRWLQGQEHPFWGLVQQNEASDWADIMPRSGFVLYTNALWYQVKKLYRLPAQQTRQYALHFFDPLRTELPEHRRARLMVHYMRRKAPRSDLFLSYANFASWGEEGDLFGNLLAALTGIADTGKAARIARHIEASRVLEPWPLRVVEHPLTFGHRDWRPYMERHRQNLPWQYHNGGCWPFVGGFWVLLLARLGRHQQGWEELARLAEANRVGDWEFNEWFHGRTGEPMGMAGQSWNAALFVLAYHALSGGFRLF